MDKYEVYIPAGEKAVGQLKVRRLIDGLDEGKSWDVKITQHRVKRSLSSNAYAWSLMDQIAGRLHESKESVYRGYVKEIGNNSEIVTVKHEAVDKLCKTWNSMGIGFVHDILMERPDGFTDVMLYYGSSTYNQSQMNRLLDLIVQDCKALEIETLDDIKIKQLIEAMGGD